MMGKPKTLVDIYTYFGSWTIHHQLDWFIASELQQLTQSGVSTRIFSCSHKGISNCAINRAFKSSNSSLSLPECITCQNLHKHYFSSFPSAHNYISAEFVESIPDNIYNSKFHSFALEYLGISSVRLKNCFEYFLDNLESLSLSTAMTHFRLSKPDLLLDQNKKLRNYFSRTLLLEALNILANWNQTLPTSIVTFNARLAPYCVPFALGKFLSIPVYIHERGTYKSYAFFFNERPSAGKARIRVMTELKKNNIITKTNITDSQLMEALKSKFNTLQKPSNFPDFYQKINSYSATIQSLASQYKKIISYVVSSEDEADTEIEYSIGTAQRNAIKELVTFASSNRDYLVIIKVHPNIYGVNGYPGMNKTIEFFDSLSRDASTISNFLILGKNSKVNPYKLVSDSDIVIGLHSSLMVYSWFIGKCIITYSGCILKDYTTLSINFNNSGELSKSLDHILTTNFKGNGSSICSLSKSLFSLVINHYAFDIDSGDVKIGTDHFSPAYPLDYLQNNYMHLDSGQLSLLIRNIVEKQDINLQILQNNVL